MTTPTSLITAAENRIHEMWDSFPRRDMDMLGLVSDLLEIVKLMKGTPMRRPYTLETCADSKGYYRWRLIRGGRIVADSAESYVTKATLRRAVLSLSNDLFNGNVVFKGVIERGGRG